MEFHYSQNLIIQAQRVPESQNNYINNMIKWTKAKGSSLQKDPQTIKRIKMPQVIGKSNVAVHFQPSESLKFNFIKKLL